jgi:hypothetical protein
MTVVYTVMVTDACKAHYTISGCTTVFLKMNLRVRNIIIIIIIILLLLLLLTAIGLKPGGSGYFTCTQIWRGGGSN